jgi:hypothetical protein
MRRPSGRTVTEVTGIVLAAIAVGLSVRGAESTRVSLFAFVSAGLIGIMAFGDTVTARFLRRAGVGAEARTVRIRSLMSILVLASVGLTHWPLRAAYAISRSSFDDAARRIRAGEPIRTPTRIGLFTICEAELGRNFHAQVACFWTDLDPAGKTGFVQCGEGEPPFNLWSSLPLGDGWQLIAED